MFEFVIISTIRIIIIIVVIFQIVVIDVLIIVVCCCGCGVVVDAMNYHNSQQYAPKKVKQNPSACHENLQHLVGHIASLVQGRTKKHPATSKIIPAMFMEVDHLE